MTDVKLLNGDDWEKRLLMNDSGTWPKVCLANIVTVLQNHVAWEGAIAFDESRGDMVLAEPGPIGDLQEGGSWKSRMWGDADDSAAAIWLQRMKLSAKPAEVAQAVRLIASRRRINPVATYLQGLQWDGVARLDTWLCRYAGAEDSAYVRGVGAAWMRSAVARALQPGCKVDTALILEGAQGRGKSTLLAILGGDHFTDDVADLHSTNAQDQIRRAWIVELPELAAGRRSEVEAQKAFVARQVDRYRPAWQRYQIASPRRCVFAGTTNAQGYLQDGTGNRRWWPVVCSTIDLQALRADRDQLWAEAVAGYRSGLGWGLDPALWGTAAGEQEARHFGDAWEDAIAEWVERRESVSVEEVLTGCIDLKRERHGRHEQMRVSGILQRLRWHRRQVREGDRRPWRYFPPDPDPSPTSPSPTPVTNPVGVTPTAGNLRLSPTSPTCEAPGHGPLSGSSLSSSVGDLGDVGDKKRNIEVSGVTNGGTNPPSEVGDRAAWEDAYDRAFLALVARGRVGDQDTARLAWDATVAQHGPCPAREGAEVGT